MSRIDEVEALVAQGKLSKTIAFELGISALTVKGYIGQILRKHGLRSRTEIAIRVLQARIDAAEKQIEEYKQERSYINGFNDGWDEAKKQSKE